MEEKPTLIYVGDPMCSWCYGIAPEYEKLSKHFEGKLNFELIVGGLRPYNTQTMVELKDFLTDHWRHVNEASQQPFDYTILNDDSITYDTEPPCRAVVTIKEIDASKAIPFFKAVQKSFYRDNKNLHLSASYSDALEYVGIDQSQFNELFNSDEMKRRVKKDFIAASQLGVSSFPTILLKNGDRISIIAQGYAKSEEMIEKVKAGM